MEGGVLMADQPAYEAVADDLRARIQNGEYAPGAQIPTLPELCTLYSVSVTTVRNALAILRTEGRLEMRGKAGTIVRSAPKVHRLTADRYRQRPEPGTPYTVDENLGQWQEYRLDKRFERITATAELAEQFGCPEGEPLLARHFVFYTDDQPTQLSTSYLLWSDVAGTPVVDPINEPWPGGTIAQLATLGITVAEVKEAMTAVMPTRAQATALKLPPGTPVLSWTRRMLSDTGRVVEVADPIVRRGDSTVVETTITL
jgi:GntR family transcriptional regulator